MVPKDIHYINILIDEFQAISLVSYVWPINDMHKISELYVATA